MSAVLGYDIESVDNRTYEVEGITGVVSNYTFEEKSYPLMCIDMREGLPSKLKLTLLQTLFKSSSVDTGETSSISIYSFFNDGRRNITKKLGKLKPSQVKSFLRIFNSFNEDEEKTYNLIGYYNEKLKLEGDMLYVLSN